MSDYPRLTLLAALLVLLGLAWTAGVFEDQVSTVEVPAWTVPEEPPNRLTVRAGGDSVRIERRQSGWTIAAPVEAPADSGAVAGLISSLRELTLSRVLTRQSAQHGQYGVGEGATRLSVRWPGRTVDLRIGGSGSGMGTRYVRLEGDDRVIVAEGRLQVETDLSTWRDKTLLSLAPSRIEQIAVTRPDASFDVARTSDGSWEVRPQDGSATAADSASVERWIRRLAALEADGLIRSGSPEAVRGRATHGLTVQTAGSSPVSLSFREDSTRVAAVTGTQDAVFEVRSGRISRIVPSVETLTTAGGGIPGGRAPPRSSIPVPPGGSSGAP